jgi:hypothetical protein
VSVKAERGGDIAKQALTVRLPIASITVYFGAR